MFSAYRVDAPGVLKLPAEKPRYSRLLSLLNAGVAWNEDAMGGWKRQATSS